MIMVVKMKRKTVVFGVVFILFWGLFAVVSAAAESCDRVVKESGATPWRAAFPDAVAGGSGVSGGKNLNENFQFTPRPRQTLSGRWVCHTENGDVSLNFISANQLNFNGDTAGYSSTADKIFVQADGRTITYPYVFNDKGLLITFPDGIRAQFVRDLSPAAATGNIFPQLVGEWKDIRSSGNTVITLGADGQYVYYSDFAAGNSSAGAANWGTAGSSSDRGTWRARGTARAGTIFYKSQDGSSDTLNYEVHVENGRTYWGEYYFAGTIYVKQ